MLEVFSLTLLSLCCGISAVKEVLLTLTVSVISFMVGKSPRLLRVVLSNGFLVGFLGLPLLRHLPRGRLETIVDEEKINQSITDKDFAV